MSALMDREAAKLAVSRFGAAEDGVRAVLEQVKDERRKGDLPDLLSRLVSQQLITEGQAQELFRSLDKTTPDLGGDSLRNGESISVPTPSPNGIAQVIGPYELVNKIGEGGMGEVFLARRKSDGNRVAIKILNPALAENASLLERFEREARNSGQLNHLNIVRGLDVGKDESSCQHFLVMEYVDGKSVQAILEEHGPLEIGDAVRIVKDIARGLEHAHARNIIHRDIKPENILVTRSGIAKLADLGLSKQMNQNSRLTATRQGFGTVYYLPYEQAVSARNADGRSDIYALGATLYHMVAGDVPFKGRNHLEIMEKIDAGVFPPAGFYNEKVPNELETILGKMMARQPEDRHQTVSELIIELDRSGLVSPMLSFADEDLARSDPEARALLESVASVTQPNLNPDQPPIPAEEETWYILGRSDNGKLRAAAMKSGRVIEKILAGQLQPTDRASRNRTSDFHPLGDQPLFAPAFRADTRQLSVHTPEPESAPGLEARPVPWLWLFVGAASSILIGGTILYFLQ